MINSSRTSVGRRAAKWLLKCCFAPLLSEYTVVKSRKRFTDSDAALRMLAPLMKEVETANYHKVHLERYLTTMEYLADMPKTTGVLEIGAPPYGMTILLRQWLFDQVSITGYDEKAEDQCQKTSERMVAIATDKGTTLYEGREKLFNVEIHQWPFRDEEFDLVIACETFEHLGLDPMHAYAEANRVLKTGGRCS